MGMGVHREDHGYQDRQMDGGGHMPAHVEYFITRFGLAVEHPDAVKRICNIPTDGGLTKDDRAVLIDMVLRAQKLLSPGMGTVVIYVNLAVEELIEKAAREIEAHYIPKRIPGAIRSA